MFEAESFSIYLIKEHDDNSEDTATPRVFYHFLSQNYTQVEDGEDIYYTADAYSFPNKYNEMVDTQIIKNGEKLQEVVIPENNDAGMFYGWYKVNFLREENGLYYYNWGTGSDTPERQEFNTAVTVPTSSEYNNKDQHIYLAPLYGHYRFLTFHQAEEGDPLSNMIIARKLIVLNSQNNADIKISDVRAPSSDPNKIVFWGWKFTHTGEHDPYASQHGNDPTEIVRTVDEDDSEIDASINIRDDHTIEGIQPSDAELKKMIFDIWPVFKQARWFYFDTGGSGAEYVPARFVIIDGGTKYLQPANATIPKRNGYLFTGWWCKVEKDGVVYDVQLTSGAEMFNSFALTDLNPYDPTKPGSYDDGDGDPSKLTLNPGVWIEEEGGGSTDRVLKLDESAGEQYFYAKWIRWIKSNMSSR